MKTDPRTSHRISIGEVTAVLRRTRLTAKRQPVQFERSRTMDDRAPRHADDTTVTDTRCYVLVTDQRETTLGDLTDQDAKHLGFRSRFLFKLEMNDAAERLGSPAWDDRRRVWLVTLKVDNSVHPRFLAPVGGYTSSRAASIDPDGESVDEFVQRDISKEARTHDELRNEQRRETWQRERDALAAYDVLRVEMDRAERLGTDLSREASAVRRMVANMRKKNDRRAA